MSWLIVIAALLSQVPEKTGKELTLDMHERYAYATMMRTALIHGYPERTRRHANQLAQLLTDEKSKPLAEIAQQAAEAEDPAALAGAVARLGEACGSCHVEKMVQPLFLGNVTQPLGNNLKARMGRHIWAADRMWQGLISHSLAPWQQGAKMLKNDPFLGGTGSKSASALLAERVKEVSELAEEAVKPGPWKKRAEIYGRFLGTCVACHQAYAGTGQQKLIK